MTIRTSLPVHILRTFAKRLLCMAAAFALLRCLLLPPFWTDRRLDLTDVGECDFTLVHASCFDRTEVAVTDPDAQALFYVFAQQARAFQRLPPGMLLLGGSDSVVIRSGDYVYDLTLYPVTGATFATVCASKTTSGGEAVWGSRIYHVPLELMERVRTTFYPLGPEAC